MTLDTLWRIVYNALKKIYISERGTYKNEKEYHFSFGDNDGQRGDVGRMQFFS